MDWTTHFPAYVDPDPSKVNLGGARNLIKDVEVVDIGCGFGGLSVDLAPYLPDKLILGTWAARRFLTPSNEILQEWKSAPKSSITSGNASPRCEPNNSSSNPPQQNNPHPHPPHHPIQTAPNL